jgi:acetyl-CoA acetyltransferase
MTMAPRYPIRDQIAIVGVGTSEYGRDTGKTLAGSALVACVHALRDAGLQASDVDGVFGSDVLSPRVQAALGIPAARWVGNHMRPFSFHVVNAMNAVFAGACETALIYHSVYRPPGRSRSAASDALRVSAARGIAGNVLGMHVDSIAGAAGYAAWASRYLHDYPDARREHLGLVAINSRTNAGANDHAVMREPMTMEDYLGAKMVREPLGMLDMDLPIDGGDALVVTTVERARDLPKPPVIIHAASLGQTGHPQEDQTVSLREHAQTVAAQGLWERSHLTSADVDLVYPYDGFTILSLLWLEALGFCGVGEAGPFVEKAWSENEQRIRIDGRVLVNTHGGSLSEGGTQGAGHLREAVQQLRGEAGSRQSPGAGVALVAPGGMFFNASAFLLRSDNP